MLETLSPEKRAPHSSGTSSKVRKEDSEDLYFCKVSVAKQQIQLNSPTDVLEEHWEHYVGHKIN